MFSKKQIILLFGCLAITGASHSFASSDFLNDVYAKEDTANRLFASLYSYEAARNHLFGKGNEFFTDLNAFEVDIQTWLNGYGVVKTLAASSDLDQISAETVNIVQKQSAGFCKLQAKAESLKAKLELAIFEVKSDSKIPPHQDLQYYIQDLDSKRHIMDNQIKVLSEKISIQISDTSELTKAFTVDFFAARYKAAAIAAGTEDAMQKYLEFIDFIKGEIIGEPILADLISKEASLEVMMINLQGMRLRPAIISFEGSCEKYLVDVSSSGLKADQRQRLSDDIKDRCEKVRHDYNNSILIYSPTVLAKAMHKQNLGKNRLACQGSPNDHRKRCDVFAWLKTIDIQAIMAFSDTEIQDLEQAWTLVEGQ